MTCGSRTALESKAITVTLSQQGPWQAFLLLLHTTYARCRCCPLYGTQKEALAFWTSSQSSWTVSIKPFKPLLFWPFLETCFQSVFKTPTWPVVVARSFKEGRAGGEGRERENECETESLLPSSFLFLKISQVSSFSSSVFCTVAWCGWLCSALISWLK